VLLAGCGSRGSLPSYGVVPDFTLTDQRGQPFDSRIELNGKVWVASFVFTTCSGPCPRMSAEFRNIRESARELKDFRLVSFTIDPQRDTPAALSAYSMAYGAEPSNWAFLTGSAETLGVLSDNTFHLAKLDGSLEHSTRFALVDRKGRIRGYYDSRDRESLAELQGHIAQLLEASI
jgi:protein SCO1/2